jgi:hypothetical protein
LRFNTLTKHVVCLTPSFLDAGSIPAASTIYIHAARVDVTCAILIP